MRISSASVTTKQPRKASDKKRSCIAKADLSLRSARYRSILSVCEDIECERNTKSAKIDNFYPSIL